MYSLTEEPYQSRLKCLVFNGSLSLSLFILRARTHLENIILIPSLISLIVHFIKTFYVKNASVSCFEMIVP